MGKAQAYMRFHRKTTNLEAVGRFLFVDKIAPMHFDKPQPPIYKFKSTVEERTPGFVNHYPTCLEREFTDENRSDVPLPCLIGGVRSPVTGHQQPASLTHLPVHDCHAGNHSSTKFRRETQTFRHDMTTTSVTYVVDSFHAITTLTNGTYGFVRHKVKTCSSSCTSRAPRDRPDLSVTFPACRFSPIIAPRAPCSNASVFGNCTQNGYWRVSPPFSCNVCGCKSD
jgi:hypothetical protein